MSAEPDPKPVLLVLASTYPRWRDDPEPGFVHELCKRLVARFRVIAVVPDAPGADPSGVLDGVEVVRYRYAPRALETLVNAGGIAVNLKRSPWKWLLVPGFVLGQYRAAWWILRRARAVAIHAHWLLPQGLVALRLARVFAVPYVVTSHGGDLFGLRGRLPAALKRRVAAGCAGMTVVSTAMRDEVTRLQLCPPLVDVLPMGVDLRGRFVPDPEQSRDSDELLFVGRLVAKKGLRHLLDALPGILAVRPTVRLTIAGFGPEQPALQDQVKRLGIAASVTFAGATPQRALPALYRRAAVFVAPFVRDATGNQEGLPVALMEAIGCGCPVVVGNVAGVRDLLGAAADAISVDPRDPRALAAAILASLQDPAVAAQRALALRAAAIGRIDWSHIAAGYADFIAQTCRVAA
ncbi:MAG TPA: glycosyltransferase [Rhodanobacteraceae bacterium]|nr:glycosyltransferase [Rhodanobacteraceae bacterium]